jgi:dUTP pyrophosphatase
LTNETLEVFNTDVSSLLPLANDPVVVRCDTCLEKFHRSYVIARERHNCPKYILREGGVTLQRCYACNTYVNTQEVNDFICRGCECNMHPVSASKVRSRASQDQVNYLNEPVRFEFRLTDTKNGKLPYRKRVTDAGYDIASVEHVIVPPHGVVNLSTGIRVACPPGTYFTIEGRSSMWINGVMPHRGIIDSGYNGDLMVALMNISDVPYEVKIGDRIAQIIGHRHFNIDFCEVHDFSPDYDTRGTAGFGSSGKQ